MPEECVPSRTRVGQNSAAATRVVAETTERGWPLLKTSFSFAVDQISVLHFFFVEATRERTCTALAQRRWIDEERTAPRIAVVRSNGWHLPNHEAAGTQLPRDDRQAGLATWHMAHETAVSTILSFAWIFLNYTTTGDGLNLIQHHVLDRVHDPQHGSAHYWQLDRRKDKREHVSQTKRHLHRNHDC